MKAYSINGAIIMMGIITLTNCRTTKNEVTTGWTYNEPEISGFETSPVKQKKLSKRAALYFKDMLLIEGGTFNMGRVSNIITTIDDTTLLESDIPRRVTVVSFYLCNHEVTNAEYREFVNWVRDSIALWLLAKTDPSFYLSEGSKMLNWKRITEIYTEKNHEVLQEMYMPENERFYKKKMFDTKRFNYTFNNGLYIDSICIYPDTLCWINDFTYGYNEPLVKSYFWHPAYNNYPVVGVSWNQANAYCHWRTERLNNTILESSNLIENLYPSFRLPTEAEWEYAAIGMDENKKKESAEYISSANIFPWKEKNLTDKKGHFYANFGPIIDRNGYWVKPFSEGIVDKNHKESYVYTSPIKSFPANGFKLYDMAGNVAEWMLDFPKMTWEEDMGYRPFRGNVFSVIGSNDSTNIATTNKDSSDINNGRFISNNSNDEFEKDTLTSLFKVNTDDDLHAAMTKILRRRNYYDPASFPDTCIENYRQWLIPKAYGEIHNAKVLESNIFPRTVKGGSWADGPIYVECGSRTVFSENKSSCRIGFRVAMLRAGLPVKKK